MLVRPALLCAVLLVVIALISTLLPNADQRVAFSDLNSPVIDLLACAFLLLAARHTARRSKRLALAWGILALAELIYASGDVIWAVLEVFLHQTPFPSIADRVYLAYYPIFLAGVILLLGRRRAAIEMINNALDLAVILVAAIMGFWNFLIGPILLYNTDAPAYEKFIVAAYPVGDLVLLGSALLILYDSRNSPNGQGSTLREPELEQPAIPVFLLGASMLFTVFSDAVYGYRSLEGTYSSGGLLDLGWITASLLIAMAGAAQWTSMQPNNAISDYRPGPTLRARLQWVKTYLPYVWMLGAFALLVVAALEPLPMGFPGIALGVTVILGLVLIRQFITLSQNQKLTEKLQTQATSLESTNRDLNLEIAERLRVQEQLAFDVLHDQMTGLANRRLFLDRLGQAIKRSKRRTSLSSGVIFMDLDQFKVVNDSLGHASGDQLLVSVGKRLEGALRSGDTVARFGGDEFAILLDDLENPDAVLKVADKLHEVLAAPFHIRDRDVHITASIGIVTALADYEHAEDLLRDVDLAMYQAKGRGKARWVMFQSAMRDQAFSRLTLEDGLRNGLRRNEFRLFYQPITSLETDQVVAVEALLRWLHPTRGLLSPADFLHVAEESDLILPIGGWVIQEACRQLKAWQDQYPNLADVAVNVNLSNREFAQADLVDKVAGSLKASGLDGSCLRLEITERVLIENYPTANHVIAALNEMGVRVEIDDFGTGYSALAYLQQFPINAIKIDKTFISDMRRTRKGLGLVRAIVSMARELGMDTIAEGIETGEQLSELKGLLCGYGQGFLLFEPLDAAATEQVLAKL